jgi:uncharacterized membrane protein
MTSYNVASHGSHSQHFAIRRLRLSDLRTALARGLEDFWAMPSHLVFLALLYPIAGLVIGVVTAGENAFYLLYPLLSGFVLLGPFAAIGLFEMSRRRELGENPTWRAAFAVLHAPGISTILGLGGLLGALFFGWLVIAQSIYSFYFGEEPARSYAEFFNQVFRTEAGLQMIIAGNIIGLLFAIVALSISVFSFPLALDRHVPIDVALRTSLQAVWTNPLQIAVWGFIVGALMFVGMAAALMGLALVMPVLAHATWHLYRRTVGSPVA